MPTYPYKVPDVAEPLELKPGFWRQHLLQGGVPLARDGRQFHVRLANGETVPAQFKRVLLGFDIPDLDVAGTAYQYAPRLPVWLVVWCFLPICLIVLGGAIPFVLGLLAAMGNLRVMRTDESKPAKAMASTGLTGAAIGAVVVTGSLLTHLLK